MARKAKSTMKMLLTKATYVILWIGSTGTKKGLKY